MLISNIYTSDNYINYKKIVITGVYSIIFIIGLYFIGDTIYYDSIANNDKNITINLKN
tara:strand:+ start:24692 stop:24865 length:174 start_codon:yes stop_codon:yes gene_type:complete